MSSCKSTIPSENYDPDTILKAQFEELRENDEALLNFVKNTFSEYCGELKHIKRVPNMNKINEYMQILNKIDDGEKLESDEIARLKEISKLVKNFLPIFKANLKTTEINITDSQQAILISTFAKTAEFPMKGFEIGDLTKETSSNVPSYAAHTTSSALKITEKKQSGGELVAIIMSILLIPIIAYKFVKTVNKLKTPNKYDADDNPDNAADVVNISNIDVSDETAIKTMKTFFVKIFETLKDFSKDTKSAWNAGKIEFIITWFKEIAKTVPEIVEFSLAFGGKKSRKRRKSKRRQRKSKKRR
jgi:hypothetical protein